MTADAAFLLADLAAHGPQGSWDWPADLRFARHVGDIEAANVLRDVLASRAPVAALVAAADLTGHVKARRLRGLRALVRSGRVHARWIGVGPGAGSELGVNRVRGYSLVERGAP